MISMEIKAKDTLGAMQRFNLAIEDRRNTNRKVAIQFFAFTQKAFATEGANQPGGWKPLSPATIKAKRAKGYTAKALVRTGFMRASFLPFSDNDEAGLGANAFYSQWHQEGTDTLPARPMLPPIEVGRRIVTDIYGLKLKQDRAKAGL